MCPAEPPRKLRRMALRRLGGDVRGATIVEFAIILVPLCVLLLGGLDLAYQSYLRSLLQGALNDVARSASVEAPSIECGGEGTLQERIDCEVRRKVNAVARNADYDVEVRNFYEFSGVGRSEKLVTDHNNNGEYDPGDCWEDLNENGEFDINAGREGVGGADDVVFYEVTINMPRIVPLGSLLSGGDRYNITARTAIRNQPYTRQRVPPTVCG